MNWAANIWGRFAALHHNSGPGMEGQSTMATVSKIAPKTQVEPGTVNWLTQCLERGRKEVFSEVISINPGLADVILSKNANNRNLSEKRVFEYAKDMLNGRWVFNGEPIIIAIDGQLNDGQHRLQAVIESNRSQTMMFVFGVARESRVTVDQGAARTAAHYLAMNGGEYSALSAGIARIVLAYEVTAGAGVKANLTHGEVVARVSADDDIIKAAKFSDGVRKYAKGLLTPSQIGACYYLFSQDHPAEAETYLTQVCVGENIKRGDPAFAVRQALEGLRGELRFERIEICCRGWVAFRQGRKLQLAKTLGSLPALV